MWSKSEIGPVISAVYSASRSGQYAMRRYTGRPLSNQFGKRMARLSFSVRLCEQRSTSYAAPRFYGCFGADEGNGGGPRTTGTCLSPSIVAMAWIVSWRKVFMFGRFSKEHALSCRQARRFGRHEVSINTALTFELAGWCQSLESRLTTTTMFTPQKRRSIPQPH